MSDTVKMGRRVLLAAALFGAMAASPLLAEEAQKTEEVTVEVPAVVALTDPEVLASERKIHQRMRQGFEKGGDAQGLSYLGETPWREISPHETAMRALNRNLTLSREHLQKAVVDAALLEAKAVFDPVLNFSTNYAVSEKFKREKRNWKWKKATEKATVNGDFGDFILFSTGPVAGIMYDKERPAGYYWTNTEASTPDDQGPTSSSGYSLSIFQQLPWGASLNLSQSTTYSETFSMLNVSGKKDLDVSWEAPWSSSLSATVSSPLPGTKYFGPNASGEVRVRLADINKKKAFWELEGQINNTLQSVDLAYWNLVGAMWNLQAAMDVRRNTGSLVARTQRMFEVQSVTVYEKAQMEAEYARLKGVESTAWNAFIEASNALNELLGQEEEQVVYLPVGFSVAAQSPLEVGLEQALAVGMRSNPDLLAQRLMVKYYDQLVNQSRDQTRPNVSMNATITASQNGSSFGYQNYGQSMGKILEPDTITLSSGLNYSRTWGDRAAKAAYKGNRATRAGVEMALQDLENQVSRRIKDAYADWLSTKARQEISKRNLSLAQRALSKAQSMEGERRVAEYELVVRNNAVLAARQAQNAARVQHYQAQTKLLSAMGVLPSRYAERTARSDLDRRRLQMLADNKVLTHFGGQVQ